MRLAPMSEEPETFSRTNSAGFWLFALWCKCSHCIFLFLPHLKLQPESSFITAWGICYNLSMSIKILESSPIKKKKKKWLLWALEFYRDGSSRRSLTISLQDWMGGCPQAGLKCADRAQLGLCWGGGGGRVTPGQACHRRRRPRQKGAGWLQSASQVSEAVWFGASLPFLSVC